MKDETLKKMSILERVKLVILPLLAVMGIGILAIQYPHALDGFDDGYTGRGVAGLIMLCIELFLMLIWGKVGGTIIVIIGVVMPILACFLPNDQPEELTKNLTTEDKKQATSIKISLFALRAGKAYVQRKQPNQQP